MKAGSIGFSQQGVRVFSQEGKMTNNFIPTLPLDALYCVWIKAGDPRCPLVCVWIDPQFRSFQSMDIRQTTATGAKTTQFEPLDHAIGSSPKALPAEQSRVSVAANQLLQETPLVIRSLALVRGMLCFLVATFVAVSFCFGQGDQSDVHVTPRIFRGPVPGAVRPSNEQTASIKAHVDLVLVPVTVTDQKHRLVIGLEKDNYGVYDGSDRQSIRYLSPNDAPISLGIVFDTSSSMYGKLERSSTAVVQFLRNANPDDEFFLIGVADRPELLTDFTGSVDDIQGGISKATPDGRTALLDAIYLGLARMKQARNERKVLLIVSDGGENHSRYNIKEVWSIVKESGVQIYALGIFDEAPKTQAERMGPDLLAAITNITGGQMLPIHSLKKIEEVTGKLAIELRNQYLIGYRPSDLAHDGKWDKISVRMTPPQNSSRLRVYAKGGYYSSAD